MLLLPFLELRYPLVVLGPFPALEPSPFDGCCFVGELFLLLGDLLVFGGPLLCGLPLGAGFGLVSVPSLAQFLVGGLDAFGGNSRTLRRGGCLSWRVLPRRLMAGGCLLGWGLACMLDVYGKW